MVVDDEAGDMQLIRLALSEAPFPCQVTAAINGREALDLLRAPNPSRQPFQPDLMFLDLNMPQMNGKEVLQEMKADPRLATIPVVVLTTSMAERDVLASYALGASGYITKPMDLDQFFKAIRGVQEYWFGTVRRPRVNRFAEG
ncbi:MAG TPA: response regulator [Magnetospirillum sp.]|nr:response regulator [Magnetospirillum sp.]